MVLPSYLLYHIVVHPLCNPFRLEFSRTSIYRSVQVKFRIKEVDMLPFYYHGFQS